MRDTSILRTRIANLQLKNSLLDSSYTLAIKQRDLANYKSEVLLQDVSTLSDYSDELEEENSKLRKKVKILGYAIPVSFTLGVIITLLII